MKTRTFTALVMMALLGILNMSAQKLFNEDFDYPAERPLVLNPQPSTANYDELTGWTTYSNTYAAIETFTLTSAPLVYANYASGVGNALYYNGIQGSGIYKPLEEPVMENETFYISFLINFQQSVASGSEFFMGVKLNPGPSDFNWGCRLYAMDDIFSGDFMVGINKLSGGTTNWGTSGPFLKPGETYLFVVKYQIGAVVGNSLTEEKGKYDDVMSLFVNPVIGPNEPEVATLVHSDPNQSDMRRWGNTTVFGNAHSLYLRAPAEGEVPRYILDDIRIGRTWSDVIPLTSAVHNAILPQFDYHVNQKQIFITDYSGSVASYSLTTLTGQQMLTGTLNSSMIDASDLSRGLYILTLYGDKGAKSVKILIK